MANQPRFLDAVMQLLLLLEDQLGERLDAVGLNRLAEFEGLQGLARTPCLHALEERERAGAQLLTQLAQGEVLHFIKHLCAAQLRV